MKNFNEMSRGEQAYAMNEVISSLNDERAYYSNWLEIWPDGETLEEAKEDFDECSDADWNIFVRFFKNRVEMFGCKSGRSIHKDDIDGLYVPYFKNSGDIEDERGGGFYYFYLQKKDDPEVMAQVSNSGDIEGERGGGFYFCLRKKDDPEVMAQVSRVRETLTAFGYPLTENAVYYGFVTQGIVFYVDWKKWRAQKAAAFIKESIKSLLQQNCGCRTIRLSAVTQLAVGWKSGFNPTNPFIIHSMHDLTEGLCAGIKAIEGNGQTTDFDRLTTPYAADGANEGETFFDLETSLAPEEDREKDFEHLIGKYQKLLKKYEIHTDGRCFHKESW